MVGQRWFNLVSTWDTLFMKKDRATLVQRCLDVEHFVNEERKKEKERKIDKRKKEEKRKKKKEEKKKKM